MKEYIKLGKLRELLADFPDETIVWLNDDANLSMFEKKMKPKNFLAEINIDKEEVRFER